MQPTPAAQHSRHLYASSIAIPSGPGWRVVYFAAGYEPLVSLWGLEPLSLGREARRLLEELAAAKALAMPQRQPGRA